MPRLLIVWLVTIASLFSIGLAQQDGYYNQQWDDRYPGNREKPWCPPDSPWPCWAPPFYPYDPIQVRLEGIGDVIGRSMMFQPNHYVNWFLGVPYARPPTYERRFKPPESPGEGWDLGIREWDASYYRPACPQEIWEFDDRFYEIRNQSEDCLHLNIFQPNFTFRGDSQNRNYPVMVFVHGEEFRLGDAQLNPGHILAKKEVLVVTFNYRLGALGFMTTLDNNAPGNYGILDVVKVLEFIQEHIRSFRGDPNQVTLVGAGSGAGIVGLLLVSPRSLQYGYKKLFHRVIMMSGSDLCEWSTVDHIYDTDAREYTKALGRQVGCDPDYGLSTKQLIECLRYKHFEEIVNASSHVWRRYGSMAGPFGPVVDGLFTNLPPKERIVLPDTPRALREQGKSLQMEIVAGVTEDEGAYFVENITKDIIGLRMEDGMDPGTFRDLLYKMIHKRRPLVRNTHEVVAALEYEYTFWAKPDNRTAVRQNLIDLWSDMTYGFCVDEVLKFHAADNYPVWMYTFDHRSEYEPLPEWMGVPHGRDVDYLFGQPFFNETLGNITGIVPYQWDWTYLDKNISQFVQYMWVNFTRYGLPMTEWQRNVTWYPFHLHNLSLLHIHEFSWMDINYRQNHYAFWRTYYPTLSAKLPITTTPGPTPRPLVEVQAGTWAITGAAIFTLFVIGAFIENKFTAMKIVHHNIDNN